MILMVCFLFIIFAAFGGLNKKMNAVIKAAKRTLGESSRYIPTDAEIQDVFFTLKKEETKSQYAIMATFAVRNHEAIKADLSPLYKGEYYINIPDDTKTGKRQAWALYPEWVDLFNLRKTTSFSYDLSQDNDVLGAIVTKNFNDENVPFDPYDLRHAWARRSIDFKLDPRLSAKSMGHDLEEHFRTYNQWFTFQATQTAYNRILNDSDRPKPPGSS
jgi:integrase